MLSTDGESNTILSLGYLNICIIRFIFNPFTDVLQPNSNFSITFTDNHAHQGGHAVYATPINNCYNNCFYMNDFLTIEV